MNDVFGTPSSVEVVAPAVAAITNSTTEVDLLSHTIEQGSLGAKTRIRVQATLVLIGDGGATELQLRLKLGSSVLLFMDSPPPNSAGQPGWVDCEILLSAADAQFVTGRMMTSFGPGNLYTPGVPGALANWTEDTAAGNVDLKLTAQFTAADSNVSCEAKSIRAQIGV